VADDRDGAAETTDVVVTDLLARSSVRLGCVAADWESAVRQVGEVLVAAGAVTPGYIDKMIEREHSVSTFVGEGVAIPHGTLAGKDLVVEDALSFMQFPDGVDWHGDEVVVCIGIAAGGNGHVPILAQLAEILMDSDRAAALRAASSVDEVLALMTPDPDSE
jgi:PTS system mannitol-specific IIA component